jgi:two-component system alkaline phosphatase synthesis response regulator PhoP
MHRICLVEDEKSLLELLQLNLELEGFELLSFSSGLEANQHIQKIGQCDIVILDVMLPGKSGLEICRELRKISEVPVLFLSAKGTTEDRIAGLKLGGSDYLSKPFDLEELLLRVHNLLGRTRSVQKRNTLKIGDKTINFDTYQVLDKQEILISTLSKKEIELLRFFADKEGLVVSRDEILDAVWGKDQFPTTRTIDNFILVFRKLFEKDPKTPAYFHSIRSVGYKFTNP